MTKYCPSCGSPCEDTALFCTNCGTSLGAQPQTQAQPQQPVEQPYQQPYQQTYQQPAPPQYQQPYQQPVYQQPYYVQQQGMKWFKFVIYFQLILTAISDFLSGAACLTGLHYGGEAASVYSYLPAMSVLDKLMGVASIAVGVLALVARSRLAKFRANGPKLYFLVIILTMAVTVLYSGASLVVMGGQVAGDDTLSVVSQMVGQIVGAGILLGVNIVYVRKRAHLFVN